MIARKLFFRDSVPSGPRRHRAYVIGDVHGCLDLLEPLLAQMEMEIARHPQAKVSIVFLGDVVDRGPASAQVVPKLAEGALAALDRGDRATHDRLIVEASKDLRDCDVIALAQFSIAATAPLVAEATGRPVVTTPDSAVDKLMRLLKAKA